MHMYNWHGKKNKSFEQFFSIKIKSQHRNSFIFMETLNSCMRKSLKWYYLFNEIMNYKKNYHIKQFYYLFETKMSRGRRRKTSGCHVFMLQLYGRDRGQRLLGREQLLQAETRRTVNAAVQTARLAAVAASGRESAAAIPTVNVSIDILRVIQVELLRRRLHDGRRRQLEGRRRRFVRLRKRIAQLLVEVAFVGQLEIVKVEVV